MKDDSINFITDDVEIYLYIVKFFFFCEKLFPQCKCWDVYVSDLKRFSARYALRQELGSNRKYKVANTKKSK